jgi:hypothetical protein
LDCTGSRIAPVFAWKKGGGTPAVALAEPPPQNGNTGEPNNKISPPPIRVNVNGSFAVQLPRQHLIQMTIGLDKFRRIAST